MEQLALESAVTAGELCSSSQDGKLGDRGLLGQEGEIDRGLRNRKVALGSDEGVWTDGQLGGSEHGGRFTALALNGIRGKDEKEEDEASKVRLENVTKEIADLRGESDAMEMRDGYSNLTVVCFRLQKTVT